MKRVAALLLLIINVATLSAQRAEVAAKINALYACVGLINPSAEIAISPKSTLQTDVVYSPWESINGHAFRFGIIMTEYRWHLKEHFHGLYFGGNFGFQIFKLSKPYIEDRKLKFNSGCAKGCGAMIGLSIGYEKTFANRWIVDAFLGWSRMWSFYNGYDKDGYVNRYPEGHEDDETHDPWNGSEEWYPNKIGVSLGYIINKKQN